MKKLAVRVFGALAMLAFAASVAAESEAAPSNIGCTKSGMTCGSSGQCCAKSCAIAHGRVVGRCN
jgi:hypothetical protein